MKERISFAITDEQKERLQKLVSKQHVNISHLLRENLEIVLKRLEGE